MKWAVIIVAGIVVVGIIVFTTIYNQKDKGGLEQELNNDYPKRKEEEGIAEVEEL